MAYAPKGGGKPDKKKPYRDPDKDKRTIAGEKKTGLKGPATGALPPLPPPPPPAPAPPIEPMTGLGPPAGPFVPEVPEFPNLSTGLPDMNIGAPSVPPLAPESLAILALQLARLSSGAAQVNAQLPPAGGERSMRTEDVGALAQPAPLPRRPGMAPFELGAQFLQPIR